MGRPDGPPYKGVPPGNIPSNPPRGQGYNQAPTPPQFQQPPRDERPPQQPAGGFDRPDQGGDQEDGVRIRSRVYESGHSYHRSYSTVDEVTEQTPDYLASFLVDRMHRDGIHVPPSLNTQRRGVNSEVARCLQQIGDDLSNNTQLNNLIDEVHVTYDTVFKTFASVAAQIFEDGVVNWGRIVTLFYFAYRLALQCVTEVKLIQTIIQCVCTYVTGRIAKWISDRGGWTAVKEYFGSTKMQMVGVFCAGFILALVILHVKKS